jgi:carbonic anhydrase/acetyltransferase-like protein (isoleucine patch superfamily)
MNIQLIKQMDCKGKAIFIADTARVIGNVTLGDEVSIWFGAVVRGDADAIRIGSRSNIQDTAIVHVDPGFPADIGEECIIGHGAIVHGATLANNVLVGMRATIMNGAVIGEFSVIGAGAVVPEGMQIPSFSLVLGIPAKVIKTIGEEQKLKIIKNAQVYVNLSKAYIGFD